MGRDPNEIANRSMSKELSFSICLQETNSNLYAILEKRSQDTRFLKITQRTPGDWFAIAGVYGEDGTPLVAFGQGSTFIAAFLNLGRSLAANQWKPDKFAK